MFYTSERSFEEMLRCSICLEVFSEPVSTPCGHNFCKRCICAAWAHWGPCRCPLCNRMYLRRPKLRVNYLVLEMVSQFRRSSLPHMVEDMRLKVQEIQGCVELSDTEVHRERAVGLQVARALSELEKHVSEVSSRLELLRVKQFVVEVTLDPDTAHPWLVLSEDLKQVHDTYVRKKLPDSPLRFDTWPCVLGKQSFSSGRFYFEVQVKGKTKWDLGVAQECINRKGRIPVSPENGFWCIRLRNKDKYLACTVPLVLLPLQRAPQKVGVFVDYGEGLVSFYDADSADLLFSFSGCCFREKLFPYFCPGLNAGGSNSAPLVLTAVETFRGQSD
ncbi:E3 ubiquitin-protein ligase TRIM21-like [Eucyclogobius newberryi]|uniref:E3 ubiquitin-protein ligase TRIM21-like n=1 Tax=Eucyclogobius newberryi TaxID=166745 RepID=UPI003B5976FA